MTRLLKKDPDNLNKEKDICPDVKEEERCGTAPLPHYLLGQLQPVLCLSSFKVMTIHVCGKEPQKLQTPKELSISFIIIL
jgi:hypothetical protein